MHEKHHSVPPATDAAREARLPHDHPGNGRHQGAKPDGMVEMARENERFHLAPAPGAAEPAPDPFPRPVFVGLWLGAIVGGLVGFAFARLLLDGVIAVPGWELLYSMAPPTFTTFWLGMGIAAGIVVGGVGTILFAKSSALAAAEEPRRDPGAHERDRA